MVHPDISASVLPCCKHDEEVRLSINNKNSHFFEFPGVNKKYLYESLVAHFYVIYFQ